jgi:hypothetical protein
MGVHCTVCISTHNKDLCSPYAVKCTASVVKPVLVVEMFCILLVLLDHQQTGMQDQPLGDHLAATEARPRVFLQEDRTPQVAMEPASLPAAMEAASPL